MTISCPIMEPPTATRKVVFVVRPMESTDLFIDRHDKALNMSKNTKQVNVIVVSRGVMTLSCTCGCVKGMVNSIHYYTWYACHNDVHATILEPLVNQARWCLDILIFFTSLPTYKTRKSYYAFGWLCMKY